MDKDVIVRKILIPGIILTLVALLSGYLLSHVNKVTKPRIDEIMKKKIFSSIALVLPEYSNIKQFEKKHNNADFIYWIGKKKDKSGVEQNGYAFMTASPGFEDNVVSIVGVDNKGVILGISILSQKETAGFGARSIEVPSDKTIWGKIADLFNGTKKGSVSNKRPWFQEQFNGLNINKNIEIVKQGDWTPAMKEFLLKKNAITSISGATITSSTVIKSLTKGITTLKQVSDYK